MNWEKIAKISQVLATFSQKLFSILLLVAIGCDAASFVVDAAAQNYGLSALAVVSGLACLMSYNVVKHHG